MKDRGWVVLAVVGLGIVAASFHPAVQRPSLMGGRPTVRDSVRPEWEKKKAVIYVPTPDSVVDGMLRLAGVTSRDVVYDLGSGDGRIVVTAAKKLGARAVGFEIDPALVARSRDSLRREGLQNLASIRDQDLFTADLSPATVVTMYLLPKINLQLRPRLLKELRPGSRVVSHSFDMGDWKPDSTVQVAGFTIYLWRIPPRT